MADREGLLALADVIDDLAIKSAIDGSGINGNKPFTEGAEYQIRYAASAFAVADALRARAQMESDHAKS